MNEKAKHCNTCAHSYYQNEMDLDSSSRTEVEIAIAEKTVRLAKMYECHHQALPEKGEM